MRRQTWKYIAIAAFATVALTIAAGIGFAYWSPLRISSAEASRRIAAGATVLDVRSDPEWALGHMPGAVHIPISRLDSQVVGTIPKSASVVIYSRSARIAAEHLQRLGYSNVAYVL